MAWTVQRGTRYRGRYRDSTGAVREAGTFPTKKAALLAAKDKESQTEHPKPPNAPTWAEWVPRWLEHRQVDPGTLKQDQRMLQGRLGDKWDTVPLTEITASTVQAWITELQRDGLASGTIKKFVYCLSGGLRAAMFEGHLQANPVQGVKFPKASATPDRFLEASECASLQATMSPDFQFFFDLLLGTGMRWGEAVAVHWEDVELDSDLPLLWVRWAFSRQVRDMKLPKDHQVRPLPIGNHLASVLRTRLQNNGWGEPPDVSYRGSRRTHSGLVFGSVNERDWGSEWRAATRFATVNVNGQIRKVGHCRPYDLRHTYATRLLRAGVDIKKVQGLLGHSSVVVTERYARLDEASILDVRSALDG